MSNPCGLTCKRVNIVIVVVVVAVVVVVVLLLLPLLRVVIVVVIVIFVSISSGKKKTVQSTVPSTCERHVETFSEIYLVGDLWHFGGLVAPPEADGPAQMGGFTATLNPYMPYYILVVSIFFSIIPILPHCNPNITPIFN